MFINLSLSVPIHTSDPGYTKITNVAPIFAVDSGNSNYLELTMEEFQTCKRDRIIQCPFAISISSSPKYTCTAAIFFSHYYLGNDFSSCALLQRNPMTWCPLALLNYHQEHFRDLSNKSTSNGLPWQNYTTSMCALRNIHSMSLRASC